MPWPRRKIPTIKGKRPSAIDTRLSTVELFCGVGGFRIAAERCGLKTLWANDWFPKACKVYEDRFGSAELVQGDFRELLASVPAHDILSAGFPCQPFSSAGKKAGLRDPRGTLFEEIAQVVGQRRPAFFILENVKRLLSMEHGAHFATILKTLTDLGYFVEWRLLNAMHFGLPQNRQRVFIVGIRDVEPSELPAHLASIRDLNLLSDRELNVLEDQWIPVEHHGSAFPFWGVARDGHFAGGNPQDFSAKQQLVSLKTVLESDVSSRFDFTDATEKRLTESTPINSFVQGVQILWSQNGGARMGYTVFGADGLAPTLTSTTSRHYERYLINGRYRRLTNVEYARIQGFPDEHCRAVSVYDQYALIGNAVPPSMAEWVFRQLLERKTATLSASRDLQMALLTG